MSKHSGSTGNQQTNNKRERLQRWLMQDGWKIAEAHHPQASWIISASGLISLLIVQPAATSDRIDIQTGVSIADEHQKQIAAMDTNQRRDLWWRIRFDLLRMGVDYRGFDEPVREIHVMQRMFDDGLTKDRFLQRVSKIKNAQILISSNVQRALDQPPDDILNEGFIN